MAETKISWGFGYTMNLGDFESLRVDHSVEDFVREGETYDDATQRIKKRAKEELSAEVKVLKKERNELKEQRG